MKLLFSSVELLVLTGNEDPKEEVLGDCVEICLGILRVALMYEPCGTSLFNWTDVKGVLTGLEHLLLAFNASAYPSNLRNHKSGTSRGKRNGYTYEECLNVPIDFVPKNKSLIIGNAVWRCRF